MDINAAVAAIEAFLDGYEGVVEHQARPSGDDTDVIKIWCGIAGVSHTAGSGLAIAGLRDWIDNCERAIRAAIPETKPYRLQVRAEVL